MKTYTTRELQLNISKALEDLPFAITKYGNIVAVVKEADTGEQQEAEQVHKVKKVIKKSIPGANKAMQDFMANNTMLKTSDTVNKSGKTCEVNFCRKDAVEQGVWVEYNETGTHKVQLWLCAEHLEKGKRNDQADY